MKVIKFEVSFKSDGSVAGPVARQAEGGWALRDAERESVENFAAAVVRSLVVQPGVQAAWPLSVCQAVAATPELAGRL